MTIKARVAYNTKCLKCGKVEYLMVRVGALQFCNSCFIEEFDTLEIEKDTPLHKNYSKWLDIYLNGTYWMCCGVKHKTENRCSCGETY